MGRKMPGPSTHPESKNFWFRLAVPERLRAKIGKREIKLSLGTSDPAEAKIRQAQEQARWRARFRDLELEVELDATKRAPELVDRFLADMARRNGALSNVIFGLQTVITMRLFIAWGRDEFTDRRADRAFAFMPGREAWRGADFTSVADIIPTEDRDRLLARVDLLHRHSDTQGAGFAEAIGYLLRARAWDLVRIEVMMIQDHAGIEVPRGTPLFDAVAEQLLLRLAEKRPESGELLRRIGEAEPTPPPSRAAIEAPAPPTSRKGSRPLSTGLAHWISLRAPRPQSEVEARRAVSRFIELNGDVAVEQITREQILDYRDFLSRMPKNLNLEKLKARGLSLRKAVEAEAQRTDGETGKRTLSPGAVKKDVGALAAILGLLRNEGWIVDNVAEGISIAGYSKTRKGQRTPRLPLRPSMMESLFASPLFRGCAGPSDIQRTKPGTHVYQDELYWSFLFGATAGPRLEEIGQIRLDDIEEIGGSDGAPIVAIYVTGTGEGESIKNDESARVIVVHPRLLDLGFLDYVEKRRSAGADRLFDLKQSATGKWTKELSRRVNRYVDRVVTDDPRYVFHSLRHEFKDRAEATISTRVHDRITGHSPGSVAGRYGLGASIELIASELDKLDLSFVDWKRLQLAAARSHLRDLSNLH
jgi:integrase